MHFSKENDRDMVNNRRYKKTTEEERKEILQGINSKNTDTVTRYAIKLFKGELYHIMYFTMIFENHDQ